MQQSANKQVREPLRLLCRDLPLELQELLWERDLLHLLHSAAQTGLPDQDLPATTCLELFHINQDGFRNVSPLPSVMRRLCQPAEQLLELRHRLVQVNIQPNLRSLWSRALPE